MIPREPAISIACQFELHENTWSVMKCDGCACKCHKGEE